MFVVVDVWIKIRRLHANHPHAFAHKLLLLGFKFHVYLYEALSPLR